MKKKLLLISSLFVLFSGVVSASSVNGDYKGNPIVNVFVNGKKLTSDIPAINYDGATLIPLRAAVEAMGADVVWNSEKSSASIMSSFDPLSGENIKNLIRQSENTASKYNGKMFNFTFDTTGIHMIVDQDSTGIIQEDNKNLVYLLSIVAYSPADDISVNLFTSGLLTSTNKLKRIDMEDMLENKINSEETLKRMKVTNYSSTPNQFNDVTPTVLQSEVYCQTISDTFDIGMRNAQVDLGRRGIGNSSLNDQMVQSWTEKKNQSLVANGCPAQ
jgi:hypothetical protein